MLLGARHCIVYGYSYELECNKDSCIHKSSLAHISQTEFSKSEIIGAELVRVNGEKIVKPGEFDRDQQGYSFIVKYLRTGSAPENTNYILFSPHNLGRRVAKLRTHEVHDFLDGSLPRVRITQGRHLTPVGGMMAFLGFISMAMVSVLGTWPSLVLSKTD